MSGRRSRRKGHDFEREVARLLRRIWPSAARGTQYGPYDRPADVEATPYRIECKVGQRPDLWSALEQVVTAGTLAADQRPPVVVARRHACVVGGERRPRRDVAVMLLDDWLQMVERLHKSTEEE